MALLLMNLMLSEKTKKLLYLTCIALESSVKILSKVTEIVCSMLPGVGNDHSQRKRYL